MCFMYFTYLRKVRVVRDMWMLIWSCVILHTIADVPAKRCYHCNSPIWCTYNMMLLALIMSRMRKRSYRQLFQYSFLDFHYIHWKKQHILWYCSMYRHCSLIIFLAVVSMCCQFFIGWIEKEDNLDYCWFIRKSPLVIWCSWSWWMWKFDNF